MTVLFYISLICAPVVLYWTIIRPRGVHMLVTYKGAGGGWAGFKAVLWGFQTWWVALAGALATALPELLTVASGVDFKAVLPEPWGLYVGTGVAFLLPLMRAYAATPNTKPPGGEA